jgi:hypothetical protein
MNKYIVYYWRFKNDDCVDCEKIIEALNFDAAYNHFRSNNPFVKIREIKEIL